MKLGRVTQVASPFYDGEGGGGGTGDGGGGGGKEDLISRAEAKKAFEARDAAKKELKALMDSGRVLSDDQVARFKELEEAAAKAEEERAKKAGEFETLKKQQQERHEQLVKEHQKTLEGEQSKYATLSERFKNTVKLAQFGAATDYFSGSESSQTILDVELGMAYLGKYVHVEDVEDDPLGYRVVVKKPNGDTIFGADGNPAPFAEAIGELIKALPNRDRILRGSGKTGSGSSGGSTGTHQPVDLRNLTPEQLRDPKVQAQLRAMGGNAGIQFGTAFSK